MMDSFAPFVGVANISLAAIGAITRGKKDVGASEFIATLMSLTRRGVLTVDLGSDSDDTNDTNPDATLHINAQASALQDPIDADAVALLRNNLSNSTNTIKLGDVKDMATKNQATLDQAYKSWKQTVKTMADASIIAPKSTVAVLQKLQYVGYGFVVLALLLIYLLNDVLIPLIPLAIGAALILVSLAKQNQIFVEKKAASQLFQWLNSLDTHGSDVPNDRTTVQQILEYAWLFGIEQKVAKSLQDTDAKEIIQTELPYLKFWKSFRSELYTNEQ